MDKKVGKYLKNLKEKWFIPAFSVDLRSLAMFRIVLGLVIIYDLFDRSKHFIAHYTDQGILTKSVIIDNFTMPSSFSIHLLSGDPRFQAFLFIFSGIIALMLAFGFLTRFSTVLSWLFAVSLQNSMMHVNFGADVLLKILLFWGIFLPLGERFSLDSLFKKSKYPDKYFSFAVVGVMLQIGMMYFFSAIWKFKVGQVWILQGEGVSRALNTIFALPSAKFLLSFPELLKIMSTFIPFFELLILPLLLIPEKKIRIIMIVLLNFMHVSFGIFLNLGIFSLATFAATLVFLPDFFWKKSRRKPIRQENSHPVFAFVCIFFILLALIWNLQTTGFQVMPSPLEKINRLLAFPQNWNIFSTGITVPGRFFSLTSWSGELKGGSTIYLPNFDEFTYEKPSKETLASSTNRWTEMRRFIDVSPGREYFAKYICKKWNTQNTENQIVRVQHEMIPINNVGLKSIYKYDCSRNGDIK